MTQQITINYRDEETVEILANGKFVGSFNHDEHGWVGMDAGESVVRRLADALGIEIIETEECDEE